MGKHTLYLYGPSRVGELKPGGFLYHLADALSSSANPSVAADNSTAAFIAQAAALVVPVRDLAHAINQTAELLGHTPGVCKSKYINPRIIDKYLMHWTHS